MPGEDIQQELQKRPFVPLRLHLAGGKTMDIAYEQTAWVLRNTLLIVHPIAKGTVVIDKHEVIALRLIERIEQISESSAA